MDAHSITYTTESRRGSSKIYRDLRSCGFADLAMGDELLEREAERGVDGMDFVKTRTADSSNQPHIGIVGAGVAGLRCADVLLQQGFKVTILEARGRVGGRMHQELIPNTPYLVDCGPNWIHGTENNPILGLALETGTATQTWGESAIIFGSEGKLLNDALADELWGATWEILIEGFRHSNQHCAEIGSDVSLWDWFLEKVPTAIPESVEGWEEKRKAVFHMCEVWGSFVGSSVKKQSLKWFWLEENINGENLFCASTYEKILERMAKPALSGADIRFKRKVTKIASDSGVDGKVVVEMVGTETGASESLFFDEVVVTAPLGWLKKNLDAFSPELPIPFRSAVEAVGYGCLEKVYLTFPVAFWDFPDTQNTSASSSTGETSTPSTGHSSVIPPAAFTLFLNPDYTSSNPSHWTQEMLSLSALPGDSTHPTLLFYIHGSQSLHFSNTLASLPDQKSKDAYLYNFFRPYYSRLPGFKTGEHEPVAVYTTDWLRDEFAGFGSYTNFQTKDTSESGGEKSTGGEKGNSGVQEGDRAIETLRTGCPSRGVWFAGEHTAPFVALGTVTGAWWSGERVGKGLGEIYKMGNGWKDVK